MNKLGKHFLSTALLLILFSPLLFSQNRFFTDAGSNIALKTTGKRTVTPEKYRSSVLDLQSMKDFLWALPGENNSANRQQVPIVELPLPDGKMAKFHVWESPVMEPGLAARYPEIKTFEGQGIDDPYATVRFDFNPYFGFSAQVLSINGDAFIDPYAKGDIINYISYFSTDNKRNPSFTCTAVPNKNNIFKSANKIESVCKGTQLYKYRLALACTGEYAVAVCNPNPATVPATLAAMVTSVNRVDGIYESELDVRMVLVSNTDQLIYLDGSTDPYTNNNGSTMLGQNQTNIDAVIGAANYDFGHVFSTGGGGIAMLGVICINGYKAQGVTGLSNPVGDKFDIDYVAHEMGHQFGADHTFNSTISNCGGGNREETTAYEVGSGTTIMSYAGICGADNIQPHSDPFFHAASFDQINDYIASFGGSCAVITNTGNNIPVITSMNNNGANIPARTPFTLKATAMDPDGDALTYSWDEWDLGPSTVWNGGNANATSPLFKTRIPKTTGNRTFPDSSLILANYSLSVADLNGQVMGGNKGETLPTGTRTMNFKLTVRDNRAGGGGVASGGTEGCQAGFNTPFTVNVIGNAGPFVLTSPNGGESYSGNSTITVTWNVAGTNASPINAANVKISLSIDGGLSFPILLSASTPNDGSENLLIPNTPTTQARIKIEAVNNVFFTISASNFSITVAGAPLINRQPANDTVCVAGNATFSVSAGGLNISYQWQESTDGGNTFNNISSATSFNLPVSSVSAAMDGYLYRCVITGSVAPAATSNAVTLKVISPVAISTQPSNAFVCATGPLTTGNISFMVTGNSSQSISYQWQESTDGGVHFNNLNSASAVTSTLSLTGVSTNMNNNLYRCLLSNATCTVPTVSSSAVLTVYSLPAVTLSASPYTHLFPGLTTTLTATPNPLTGTSLTWFNNSNQISGQTGTTFSADVTGLGNYQVIITDGNGCSNKSAVVTIADSASDKLFIYPNPNLGRFIVSYYNRGGASIQRSITIYDSHGARVYTGEFAVAGPYQLLNIDMKIPARGIYYVVVGDAEGKKIADGKVLIH
ncbi:MAG: T9SS type A sorting domain-containing protein [Chitinophagaceae bacterium]|nr:T9SS type A sorting domain-containing protein [Chitinophagaceae bacterium]